MPRALLGQHVHGVRGHAHDVGGARLDQPVQARASDGRLARDEHAAADQPLRHRNPGDVM